MSAFNWLEDILNGLLPCKRNASGDPDKSGPSRVLVELEAEPLPTEPSLHEYATAISETADLDVQFAYLDKAVKITGEFEGRGYGQVTGDFDKQGMSVGLLQWNFGQGSLQKVILQTYRKRYGRIANTGIFPDGMLVDAVAECSPARGLELVRKRMLKGTKVRPEWKTAWQNFLTTPQVMNLQIEGCAPVAMKAHNLCLSWNMMSERSFCFFFDIVTQNGSMKKVQKKDGVSLSYAAFLVAKANKQNRKIWMPLIEKATPEQLTLLSAAFERALVSNPTYFHDVYSRKGTIALGRGFVHGRQWDLFPTRA